MASLSSPSALLRARPELRARPVLRRAAPGLRRAAPGLRRFQTTPATRAADAARDYQARAQQGLSRVASAAGPAIAGAARGLSGALGRIGGRTGRLVAFVERQTPFVVYYSKVGLEMSKIVFHGQKMNPPSIAAFQTFYQNLWHSIRSGAFFQTPQNLLQQLRNLGVAQLAATGVVVAECLGFFTVGEMVGRLKLVGYHGEPGHRH